MNNHILYINPTAVHGGAEEALLRTMEAAQSLGYAPVLVVPQAGWLTEQCRLLGIPCELLPSLPDTFAADTWREQLKPWLLNGIAIAQLVRKWNAILVHSNTPRSSYHGGLGARLARVRAITHVHDIVGLPYASSIKARVLASLADHTLVPSNAVREVVTTYAPQLGSRIDTLYYGWNIDRYAGVEAADVRAVFGLLHDSIVIGTVAALTPWKGQDVLIEVFRQLRNEQPNARLLIVGGTQGGKQQSLYEQQLRQQVAHAGLDDVVVFTGWREDVWSLMLGFDIFVHVPTKPDPLPTALLHACALGCAIVASEIGGIPEIVEDGRSGLIVPPGDAAALCDRLNAILKAPHQQAEMRQQARERFVQRFNAQQMKQGLAQAYSRCLSTEDRVSVFSSALADAAIN